MSERIQVGGLSVASELWTLVNDEIIPGTGIEVDAFWQSFEDIITSLTPRNRELLAIREEIQQRIDSWHRERAGQPHDHIAYKQFLSDIGYLVPTGEPFSITTEIVDPEIATIAGPQLVVPITNARYSLNAANARWGSLYDALYGNDVISEADGADSGPGYNPVRGAKVIAYGRGFLDAHCPLAGASHVDARAYRIEGGSLVVTTGADSQVGLSDGKQLVGYTGNPDKGGDRNLDVSDRGRRGRLHQYSTQYLLGDCHHYHRWLWGHCAAHPGRPGVGSSDHDSGLFSNCGADGYHHGGDGSAAAG